MTEEKSHAVKFPVKSGGELRVEHRQETPGLPGHYEIYLPGAEQAVITVWETDGIDMATLVSTVAEMLMATWKGSQ